MTTHESPNGFSFYGAHPYFYSVPTSPTRAAKASLRNLECTSFADELFQDGLLLPLKLPPRLQHASDRRGSCFSSPKLPFSMLKLSPFSGSRSKGEDFDPFKVALEQVRKHEARRDQGTFARRAQSLSPLRTSQWMVQSIGGPPREVELPRSDAGSDGSSCKAMKRRRFKKFFFGVSRGRMSEESKTSVLSLAHDACNNARKVAFEEMSKKKGFVPYWASLFVCFGV